MAKRVIPYLHKENSHRPTFVIVGLFGYCDSSSYICSIEEKYITDQSISVLAVLRIDNCDERSVK